jgi:hypothetical protein
MSIPSSRNKHRVPYTVSVKGELTVARALKPASPALLGAGLAALHLFRRRRNAA